MSVVYMFKKYETQWAWTGCLGGVLSVDKTKGMVK